MMTKQQQTKKPRGRPVTHIMPPPIPDTPENIARAVLNSPTRPPGGWQYLKDYKASLKRLATKRKKA